jgi:hypothetical protein
MGRDYYVEDNGGVISVETTLSRFEREAVALEADICEWLEESRSLSDSERHSEVIETLKGFDLPCDFQLDLIAYLFRRLDMANESGEQATKLENFLAPAAKGGMKYVSGQRLRAAKPRADEDVEAKIESMASGEGSAKALWSNFFSWLEEGHHPREDEMGVITYECDSRVRTMAFGTFQNKISRARKSQESR